MTPREELEALRRLAELEAKARGGQPVPGASKQKGGIAGGVFMGLRDPIDAGAQLLVRGVDAAVSGINSATGLNLPRPDVANVDQIVNQANREYADSRRLAGRDGMDGARIVGNVVNPANLAGAKAIQGANALRTAGGVAVSPRTRLMAGGAGAGAVGGALQPVVGEREQQDFGSTKAVQTGIGAVGGAVLAPVVQKAGEGLVRAFNSVASRFGKGSDPQTEALKIVDAWVKSGEIDGFDLSKIPASMVAKVRLEVAKALKEGKQLDPAAVLRKADFEALGIQPTQGQVTRNPMQFAREKNMRGIEGAGEALTDRFQQQNQQILSRLGQKAQGALEPDDAGVVLTQSLREIDEPARQRVTKAYQDARASAGKDVDLWRPEFAREIQGIVENYGDRVPNAVAERLKSLGLIGDAQAKRLINFDEADKLLKQINSLQSSDRATNSALGELRNAVKKALTADPGLPGDPYTPARQLAAARFKVIDETPGLAAALDNEVPDKFVKKYLIGGDTKSVNKLMTLLGQDEDVAAQARAQVGAYLRDKTFGSNAAGDVQFSQKNFNEAIKTLGTNKLTAIFGKEGAEELQRMGRVMAYIQSQPAASSVNNSGTAAALMNLLSRLSGKVASLPGLNLARDSVRQFGNERFAGQALRGEVPALPAELPEEVRNTLLRYLTGPAAVAGAIAVQ